MRIEIVCACACACKKDPWEIFIISTMAPSREFRLVVVGPPVVGKSALTIRLTQSEFANEYDPTIEDSYRYLCQVNDMSVSLDILDTAGQEEYSSMRDLYMKTGEGFLLVFSLNDRQTFEEISTFYNQIIRVKGEMSQFVPIMLVGNKNDLIDERQVSHEEAIHLAKRFDCAYIETSAKTGVNVTSAFHGLVKMIMNDALLGVGLENTLYPSPEEERNAVLKNSSLSNSHKIPNNNSSDSINKSNNLSNQHVNMQEKAADSNIQPKTNNESTKNNKTSNPANTTQSAGASNDGGCCVIM